MPAGVAAASNKNVDVVGAWKDFLAAEAAAKATRDAAYAALNQSGAVATMQTAFNTYQTAVKTALDNAQAVFSGSINQVSNYFQGMFDSFQAILSGGGTVATGVTASNNQNTAVDNAIAREGGAAKEVQKQSSKRALIFSVKIAENTSFGTTSFELGDDSKLFADEIVIQSGPEGSYAMTSLKTIAKDDDAATIGARSTGPMATFRGAGRGLVKIGSLPVLCGPIKTVSHSLEPDGATVVITDDMYTMEGIHVKGTFHYNPATDDLKYNRAGICRFNPDGRPNCIDSPFGPVFAPYPDFGLKQGEYPGVVTNATASTEGQSDEFTVARLWTLERVVAYLRFALYDSQALEYTSDWVGYKQLESEKVIWPVGLSGAILGDGTASGDPTSVANGIKNQDTERGSKAKMPDKDITDWNLKDALNMVVESAGGYALYMFPNESLKNTLTVVRTRVAANISGGLTKPLKRRVGSKPEENDLVVHSGKIEKDFSNSFSSVSVSGDNFILETQVKFDPSDLTDYDSWADEQSGGNYVNTILPGWTEADELAFRKYIEDPDGNIDYELTPHAFQDASTLFPKVYCAYKLNPNWDYLNGTKYQGFPRVTPHPPILSHLLTWTSEALEGSQKRRLPLQIPVEVYNSLESRWELVTKLDGLEVDMEGNFYLPALREARLSGSSESDDWYKRTWKGSLSTPTGMRPNKIRMTVAIVTDVLLETVMAFDDEEANGPANSANNSLGLMRTGDPNGERAQFTRPFGRQYHAAAGASYRAYARKSSGAVPASVSTSALDTDVGSVDPLTNLLGPNGQGDRCTAGQLLLDESEFCKTHTQRRFCAVSRPQVSAHFVFKQIVLWRPGTIITKFATRGDITDSLHVNAVLQKLSYSYEEQETVMDCT